MEAASPQDRAVRYGGFNVSLECARCGKPTVLTAPTQTLHCEACGRDTAVPDVVWQRALVAYDDAYGAPQPGPPARSDMLAIVGGSKARMELVTTRPRCAACTEVLDGVDEVALGAMHCGRCGAATHVLEAPPWLQQVVPTATRIFMPGDATAAPGGYRASPGRPVVLPCTRCGAALEVNAASPRVVPCAACSTDVYLPDAVWQTLHPAAVTIEGQGAFYVAFEGRTHRAHVSEEKQQVANGRNLAILKAMATARVALVLACVVMAAALGWIWLMRSTAPLYAAGSIALTIASGLAALVAVFLAGRPIRMRSGFDADFMVSQVWLMAVFGAVVPFAQLVVIVMGFWRLTHTTVGGFVTAPQSGSNSRAYPLVQLPLGENIPLGLAFIAQGTLWPAVFVSLAVNYAG